MTLDIPAHWNGWKCYAEAKASVFAAGSGRELGHQVVIDGTAQQEQEINYPSSDDKSVTVGGRRTGMTTTGSRTVSYRARDLGTNDLLASQIYLYARAERTA